MPRPAPTSANQMSGDRVHHLGNIVPLKLCCTISRHSCPLMMMASIMRPALLRQGLLITTRKAFVSNSSILRACQPAAISPITSIVCQTPLVAAFHTSSRRAILPAGPQVLEGTANDPAPIPKPSPTHGSYHWTFERALSLGLVPLTIAPFAYGSLNPVMDSVLVAALLLHSHVGFT